MSLHRLQPGQTLEDSGIHLFLSGLEASLEYDYMVKIFEYNLDVLQSLGIREIKHRPERSQWNRETLVIGPDDCTQAAVIQIMKTLSALRELPSQFPHVDFGICHFPQATWLVSYLTTHGDDVKRRFHTLRFGQNFAAFGGTLMVRTGGEETRQDSFIRALQAAVQGAPLLQGTMRPAGNRPPTRPAQKPPAAAKAPARKAAPPQAARPRVPAPLPPEEDPTFLETVEDTMEDARARLVALWAKWTQGEPEAAAAAGAETVDASIPLRLMDFLRSIGISPAAVERWVAEHTPDVEDELNREIQARLAIAQQVATRLFPRNKVTLRAQDEDYTAFDVLQGKTDLGYTIRVAWHPPHDVVVEQQVQDEAGEWVTEIYFEGALDELPKPPARK